MTETTAPTPAGTLYTRSDGTPYSDHDVEIIQRVRSDLLSGRYFSLHAASGRSYYGYRPVLDRRSWSHAMTTLGRMAGESDQMAQIAARIFGHVNLYGTRPEADAQIYEAAFAALHDGYDDVVGRAAPDAGRWRDHQHPYGLSTRVHLAYWLAEATAKMSESLPGVGWCVDAIRRAEFPHGFFPHFFPSLKITA